MTDATNASHPFVAFRRLVATADTGQLARNRSDLGIVAERGQTHLGGAIGADVGAMESPSLRSSPLGSQRRKRAPHCLSCRLDVCLSTGIRCLRGGPEQP